MMRPTTLAEQGVLTVALNEFLEKRAPGAHYDSDESIEEAATLYACDRYSRFHPGLETRVQQVVDGVKLALALVSSDFHVNDMSQPEEVSSIQKGESPMPPMQQCTDNDTTMPESKRTVLTQAAIDWAKLLGYTLTRVDIDEAIYFTRRGEKVAAIKEVRTSARPVGIKRPFNMLANNGFSDFIDGQGITYTELPAAMGLKQAKDIVDMLEANITL